MACRVALRGIVAQESSCRALFVGMHVRGRSLVAAQTEFLAQVRSEMQFRNEGSLRGRGMIIRLDAALLCLNALLASFV